MANLGLGQSKFWCFTINNPKPDYADLKPIKNWEYMVVGNEVGESGTPHLQGFVVYKTRTKFSTVKNQIPAAHIEKMKGSPTQASDYCKKDGNFEEFGTCPETGWKSGSGGGEKKAENFRAMINHAKNQSINSIEEVDPVSYVQHYHAFKRIAQDNPKKVKSLPDVCGIWYQGPPGVGKSHKARETYPDYYDKPANKWFDGYQGEDAVLIDDLDLCHSTLGHHLKRWADKYPFPAEQKGTTVLIRPKNIVVTSNYTISEIFSQQGEVLVAALERRFQVFNVLDWKLGMPGDKFPKEKDDSILSEDEDDTFDNHHAQKYPHLHNNHDNDAPCDYCLSQMPKCLACGDHPMDCKCESCEECGKPECDCIEIN